MESLPPLPLPVDQLPEGIRRFGNPEAPAPARIMAAKGLVPVKGADLVTLLAQLRADGDPQVAETAGKTLEGLPEPVLLAACEAELHPSVLDALARRFAKNEAAIERIVLNRATADATLARIAAHCSERTAELIATNQQRLLGAPAIIEALYKNRHTRMSTVDRLVELAARNQVELKGIPAFQQHVEAIRGQLIPEATDEPLPGDLAFHEALEEDAPDEDAVERDRVDGSEEIKSSFQNLQFKIREMMPSEKIRLALIGDAAARAILVRDTNRIVSHAAISSPRMSETEVVRIAHSKEVSDDVLRFVGNKKDWVRNYEIKRALVFNPKCPTGVAMKYVSHLRDSDLRGLSRSRNVPMPIKTAAKQRLQMKNRSK
ncbi:MAG: hypothetical protein ACODAU_09380 [Myxococcota bacterium]